MIDADNALIAFASTLVVAVLTAVFAYLRYVREQEHQRQTLLNALFAELANILEHYTYAAIEMPIGYSDAFEVKKRLKWAKYGPLKSANDIGKLGFLDAPSIESLLQLELLMRNDNTYLDQLLEDEKGWTDERLKDVKSRLCKRSRGAAALLESLVAKRPALSGAFIELKKQLPVDPDA